MSLFSIQKMASRLIFGGPGSKSASDVPWYATVALDSAVASALAVRSIADPKLLAFGVAQAAVGSLVGAPLGYTLGAKVLGEGSSGVAAVATGVAGAAAVAYATGYLGLGLAPRQAAMAGALAVGLPAIYDMATFGSGYATHDVKQAAAPP